MNFGNLKTIQEAKPSSSTTEVQSFIGMATYCAKFIPNISDITKPLRELTKKKVNVKRMFTHTNVFYGRRETY